jgi:hypothetical protein
MKKLIIILLFPLLGYSQNTVSTLVGYKSFEVNFKMKGDLNYGVAVSITDAKEVAKRATRMDHPNKHIAKDKLTPSLFFLIGATFEDITITGKLGATYFEQNINGKKEAQNIYRSVGVQVQYKKFIFSYDSANSAMIGYEITL